MKKRVAYHIAFWLGYVLFKTAMNLSVDSTQAFQNLNFDKTWILFEAQLTLLIVKIPMVYMLFFITERYFLKQWRIAKTILSIFALYLFSLAAFLAVAHFIVLKQIYKLNNSFSEHLNMYSFIYNSFILLFTCSVAISFKLVRLTLLQKEAEQEIIKKKLETELQFLKAQTNPHFLFNTLNNIYALARKKSDDTADVVMKLSKLLRFILYESQKKSISIVDEIHVLDDYIELERIRYNEKLKLDFPRSIDNEMQQVAPLVLLPFVENAFKHGVGESRFNTYIHIELRLIQGQLYFMIENPKSEHIEKKNSDKIGLTNIRRQLELMYPDHDLRIENEKNYFKVLLKINLDKHAAL